jgi:hypothetical protein
MDWPDNGLLSLGSEENPLRVLKVSLTSRSTSKILLFIKTDTQYMIGTARAQKAHFAKRSLAVPIVASNASGKPTPRKPTELVYSSEILASKIVTRVDDQHAFLMNRNKLGSMVLGGDSIYLLECQSAAYAILACNEAEKEADVKLIDMRMIGANGRLYLAGTEADMRNARAAAEAALRAAGAD